MMMMNVMMVNAMKLKMTRKTEKVMNRNKMK